MRDEKIVRIQKDIQSFLKNRKTLHLSTVTKEGFPFASYAPFGAGDDCFYVLLSDIARHAVNLVCNPIASVLVIADESSSKELFALERLNYTVDSELLEFGSDGWALGIDCMAERFGKRIHDLSSLADFKLFRLQPNEGRYVKGFARAYSLEGRGFSGVSLHHLREGHKNREAVPA